jgi:hypothetical protein
MTAKEYRDKEAITSANFWDGDEINFHMIYEFAEDYHQAKLDLLTIQNVGQQRELLNFLVKRNYLEADKHWIEEMLLEYNFEKILL